MIYKKFVKPIMFMQDPEKAHHRTMRLFQIAQRLPVLGTILNRQLTTDEGGLSKQCMGLTFSNPVGLAAGFDKDGKYVHLMERLGFGHVEIGTVTPLKQKGNPTPRLFRLPKDRALINRMGFNNDGVDAMVERLRNRKKSSLIIGANIGKNKDTPNEEAYMDYKICAQKLHPFIDYFVVNVSSPNTPGLRELQENTSLHKILSEIQEVNHAMRIQRPILLKISPDMSLEKVDEIVKLLTILSINGIVVHNTTTSRNGLQSSQDMIAQIGAGGLSGAPLSEKSNEVLGHILGLRVEELTVVSVGGIDTIEDATSRIVKGADLIQLYSGLVYNGPFFVKDILKKLKK